MSLDDQLEVNSEPQSPLWQLVLARVRDFYREPAAIFWVYGFPLVLAVALGTAFRDRPVERIPVTVVQAEGISGDRLEEVLGDLRADSRLEPKISDLAQAGRDLALGKTALLVIPKLQGVSLRTERNRPESALAAGAVEAALLRSNLKNVSGKGQLNVAGKSQHLDIELEAVSETGGRYIDFLVPGLLGMNLMGGGLWGLGYVTVDLRVRKLLKRLIATPMNKVDFLLSLVLGRMGFLLLEILMLLGFAWLVFGVSIQGGYGTLALTVLAGACCFQAIGLLVASRATSYEAVSGIMNLTMLPMYVLSGVFFSSDRFPQAIQPLIGLLPLTALNNSLRGVINEGQNLASISGNLAILLGWGLGAFILALKLFRWR
jgi:ABC-type multidrug transport system permease subunit